MNAKMKIMNATFLILCVINAMQMAAQSSSPAPQATGVAHKYNGYWWLTLPEKERSGYVTGSEDCRVWDMKKLRKDPWDEDQFAQAVTKYYLANSQDRVLSIVEVMDRIAPKPHHHQAHPEGGETWTNPHGFLDGQWWKEAFEKEGEVPPEDKGYVEGYLQCYRTLNGFEPNPRSINWYTVAITRYYASHDENKVVADVIHLLGKWKKEVPSGTPAASVAK